MNSSSEKEVYFHVGTERTGTTFLQDRVFPSYQGIYYIRKKEYNNAIDIINTSEYPKYLVSCEFNYELERNAKLFSQAIPQTVPIIVFRRHDSYIESQYRRYVKNGFPGSFKAFFDLQEDNGLFKKQDLRFCRQLDIVEKYFNKSPIALSYADLKRNPELFVRKLAGLVGASIDLKKLNLKEKHVSYSDKQLKTVLMVGKYVNLQKNRIYDNALLHFMYEFYLDSIRYSAMHLSKFVPDKFYPEEPLIAKNELDEVKSFYQTDWKQCQERCLRLSAIPS